MSKRFLFSCESTVDMPYSYLLERGVSVIDYTYTINGKEYNDNMGRDEKSLEEFYKLIDEGFLSSTSQINEYRYKEYFESLLKQSNYIFHLAFGTGVTPSYINAVNAANELMMENADVEIIVIDTKCASSGYGMFVDYVLDLRDEGKTIDERLEIAIQAALFLKSINKQPKIAILAAGRKDDFGRTLGIDKNLKESEDLCEKITQKLNDLDAFDNDSDDESMHFEVKNYYILIEKAIKEGNNIILAPDGVTGNIIFRTLVLLNSWPSNGAVTLGIDEIFVDTSRDQSVEGYLRSIKLAYDLAKAKKESL
jgi:hypothetical protein